ncbi:YolD-like family protein [Paenibacillus kandeliae]|uniref:YolD-like family protein n=1 Tax=Paenibacillus kandeliae TaxID=3231269 RepID=UPI0034573F51
MNNEYQDRGNKKWSAMLLPEHRDRLRQMALNEHNINRPTLDADQQEELNHQLHTCLAEQSQVRIVYFQKQAWAEVMGIIQKCDMLQRMLYVIDSDLQITKVRLHDIRMIETLY